MLVVIVGNILFIPWRNDDICSNDGSDDYKCNNNPNWLFYKGRLYLYISLLPNHGAWDGTLKKSFCEKVQQKLFVVGIITDAFLILVVIFEILVILNIFKIVMDFKLACLKVSLLQKYDFVFIFITTIFWFLLQGIFTKMEALTYGFYIMIFMVIWSLLLKFHFKYYQSRLYRRRVVNQLLEN